MVDAERRRSAAFVPGVCAMFVALVLPAAAFAQSVATSFDELRLKLKAGDTIYVTQRDGGETQATVLGLSPASLDLKIDGSARSVKQGEITEIRKRVADPVWQGALVGGAIGVAPILVMCSAASESGETCGDRSGLPY